MSKKIYFTLTGTNYYHGKDFLKSGMKVKLIKEPDRKGFFTSENYYCQQEILRSSTKKTEKEQEILHTDQTV